MRFPSPRIIDEKIQSRDIKKSFDYLIRNRSALKEYKNIEDFALRDEEYTTKTNVDEKILKGCEYHLLKLRARLHTEFRSRNLFIGTSVLDEVLFQTFSKSKTDNPLIEALEVIRDAGVLHPGIVVYPLHSLGVIGGGLLRSYTQSSIEFFVPDIGLIVTPQTNSIENTYKFIERSAKTLGVNKKIPVDLLMHWRRSRPTKWLERNPLLVFRVHSFPGDYYENQFFISNKLRIYTTALLMLNSMQNFISSREGFLFSSSRTNNWETLDIKHYFVFYPKPYKKIMAGDCVPMNLRKSTLAELSEVPAELDPKFWRRRLPLSQLISESITNVEKGFYTYTMHPGKESNKGIVYRKILKSLEFFRKSYRKTDDTGEAVVNLAVAFEILLTDNYARGIAKRIVSRIEILLKGVKGVRKFKKSVGRLYEMRSEYVHYKGRTKSETLERRLKTVTP
jgi:hypothetical protein